MLNQQIQERSPHQGTTTAAHIQAQAPRAAQLRRVPPGRPGLHQEADHMFTKYTRHPLCLDPHKDNVHSFQLRRLLPSMSLSLKGTRA